MDEMPDQLADDLSEKVWARLGKRIEEAVVGDQGLTREQAQEKLGIRSKSEFYRLKKKGLIPQPNPFTKAYSAREIDAFMAGKWRPKATQRAD